MRKQYPALDLAKFISAWLIIILHTAPFASYSKLLTFGLRHIVTVIAVPFFFATTGFLFCEKLESLDKPSKATYMKTYSLRIVIMYLFWSLVYFGFVLVKWSRRGFSWDLVLEYIKDFFFEGSYSTIWFLPAMLTAVLLVYFLRKKFSYRAIFIMAVTIHLFTLGGSSYFGLVTQLEPLKAIYTAYYSFFDTIKNGVLFGFCYISMGGLIWELRESGRCASLTRLKNLMLIGVGWILLAAEALITSYFNWNTRGCDTTLLLIPLTFLVLWLTLHTNLRNRPVYLKMRQYSILLFLTQRIPISIIEMFFPESLVYQNSFLFFIVVSLATFLISSLILFASEHGCRFLKKCY